jgi:CRISPR/Cas system-associated exonuclease Cas4 (RecB family)
MARQSLFSYKVDVTQIEGFAEKLAQFDPATMAELLVATVNEVATDTYDLARSKMLAGINLKETYVKGKMRFKAATNSSPTAEIVAPVVQVAATGAAFLMMHRSALESIRDKGFNRTFPWFQETEMDGKPVGEDLTFCIRAGVVGLPVFVNTAVKVGHHKSTLLTEDVFLAQRKAPDA